MSSHHSLDNREHLSQIRRRASNEASTNDTDIGSTQHPLLNLQRQVGNAQIARMLAQRTAEEEQEEGGAVQAMHDPAAVQRTAEEEQEEGGAVQAMHDPAVQRTAEEEQEEGGAVQAMHDPSAVQRTAEEEQEEGGTVQAKPEVGLEGGPISGDLGGRIQSKRGSGSPMDDGMRESMEGAFGTNFKDVRIHSDSESHQLNRSISAKAFTTGNDIFFGESASPADTKLLGHELTHVVQQRSMSTSGPMTVGPAGDNHEQEADAAGAAAAAAIEGGHAQRQSAEEEHETA
ncbi:MAG TPA: DUF4157 domain-containing protein [Herpetosiphonaceae bacterium]